MKTSEGSRIMILVLAGKLASRWAQKRLMNRVAPIGNESADVQLNAILGWAQPNANAQSEVQLVSHPVLIDYGQEDITLPVANAKNMAQHLPNARLIAYPGAGQAAVSSTKILLHNKRLSFRPVTD